MELTLPDLPPKILKLIELGWENGWNNYTTIALRFQMPSPDPEKPPSARPFYGIWRLRDGKWLFESARFRTKEGWSKKLGANDLKYVLIDPTVVEDEDPCATAEDPEINTVVNAAK